MSFVKKTIASAAAIAALVAVPTATAVADDAPAQGVTVQAETQNCTVYFHQQDDGSVLNTVEYACGTVSFGVYAGNAVAPSVEGKVFTGWAAIASDGSEYPVDSSTIVNADLHVYPMYKDAPEEGEWDVSFYDNDNNLIQTVSYNKASEASFDTYAMSVEAPAVDGKVFAGWATIASDGSYHPVDPASVVTGNWAVYPMYKDAPTEPEEPGKDDETTTPAEDEQKTDENKPDENKSALGETGSAVLGVSVFALLLAAGSAVIFVMRKRA